MATGQWAVAEENTETAYLSRRRKDALYECLETPSIGNCDSGERSARCKIKVHGETPGVVWSPTRF